LPSLRRSLVLPHALYAYSDVTNPSLSSTFVRKACFLT
jgi:hypothetical protein